MTVNGQQAKPEAKKSDPTSRSIDRIGFEKIEQTYSTIRTFVRTTGWVGSAYFASQAITALSGQTTNVAVTATLSVLADFKFMISITLAGAATAWAVVERSLRHRKVAYMQGRIRSLETQVDPQRTTSGLTARGETNPEDNMP